MRRTPPRSRSSRPLEFQSAADPPPQHQSAAGVHHRAARKRQAQLLQAPGAAVSAASSRSTGAPCSIWTASLPVAPKLNCTGMPVAASNSGSRRSHASRRAAAAETSRGGGEAGNAPGRPRASSSAARAQVAADMANHYIESRSAGASRPLRAADPRAAAATMRAALDGGPEGGAMSVQSLATGVLAALGDVLRDVDESAVSVLQEKLRIRRNRVTGEARGLRSSPCARCSSRDCFFCWTSS